MDQFRWLHLTDLHWGLTGQKPLWPNIRDEFFKDLGRTIKKSGPWDVVLFTGDFVQQGKPPEFAELEDKALGPLWDHFAELDCDPILLTVPGNHDLKRPTGKAKEKPEVEWLLDPDGFQKIAEKFWANKTSPYRRVVTTAFKAYQDWSATRPHAAGQTIQTGLLPGDFSTTWTTAGGHRIGIAGLNTTFLQLAGGSSSWMNSTKANSSDSWARPRKAKAVLI